MDVDGNVDGVGGMVMGLGNGALGQCLSGHDSN